MFVSFNIFTFHSLHCTVASYFFYGPKEPHHLDLSFSIDQPRNLLLYNHHYGLGSLVFEWQHSVWFFHLYFVFIVADEKRIQFYISNIPRNWIVVQNCRQFLWLFWREAHKCGAGWRPIHNVPNISFKNW